MSNTKKWWYHNGGQEQGPFSVAEMRDLASEFSPNTLVWKEGMTDWVSAAAVEGLLQDKQSAAPVFTPNNHPPSIRLQRTLGYALLLSSISVIGYFLYIQPLYTIADKNSASDTPASSSVPTATPSATANTSSNVELVWPNSPAGARSLYQLYGGSGTAKSLALSTGGTARVWISRRVSIGNTQKFVVLAAIEGRPLKDSHADGAQIDLLIYTLVNGEWVAETPQFNITEWGEWGGVHETEMTKKAEVYALNNTVTGIFIPTNSLHQGYSEDGYSIFSINLNNQYKNLGRITIAEDNGGVCDSTDQTSPCWQYTSDFSLLPAQNGLAAIQVNRHGTLKNDAGIIESATPLVYRFNGKEYSEK